MKKALSRLICTSPPTGASRSGRGPAAPGLAVDVLDRGLGQTDTTADLPVNVQVTGPDATGVVGTVFWRRLGTEEEWERATEEVRAALVLRGSDFKSDEGGEVFDARRSDIKWVA